MMDGRLMKTERVIGKMKIDKEKVVRALRQCTGATSPFCMGCPYNVGSSLCIDELMKDALALIEGMDE